MFNSKKRYFKRKLEAVEKSIWDLEFKKFKTQEIREEVRQTYDSTKQRLELVESQIKAQTDNRTMNDDEFKRLEDEKVILTRDSERYEGQLKGLDVEINGSPKTNDYPDGFDGMAQQLEALRELVGMIKSYIKII